MRDESDHGDGGGGPERLRDAYVDNLRERFSKDHIYVSTVYICSAEIVDICLVGKMGGLVAKSLS